MRALAHTNDHRRLDPRRVVAAMLWMRCDSRREALAVLAAGHDGRGRSSTGYERSRAIWVQR
jgi:hypothetical protein